MSLGSWLGGIWGAGVFGSQWSFRGRVGSLCICSVVWFSVYIDDSTASYRKCVPSLQSAHSVELCWRRVPGDQVGKPALLGAWAFQVVGVRGLRLWVLGRPGLVCLLSWASSQRPLPFFLGWRQPLQWGRAQGTWRRWPLRQPSSCNGPTVPGYWMVGPPSAWPLRLRVMPSRQVSSWAKNEHLGQNLCLEQPEGVRGREQLLISSHLLWPTTHIGSSLLPLPASFVYISQPEPLT